MKAPVLSEVLSSLLGLEERPSTGEAGAEGAAALAATDDVDPEERPCLSSSLVHSSHGVWGTLVRGVAAPAGGKDRAVAWRAANNPLSKLDAPRCSRGLGRREVVPRARSTTHTSTNGTAFAVMVMVMMMLLLLLLMMR